MAEVEEPLTTIGEWQERAVRLDRNQRQSRIEERILERNMACPGGNVQPRGRIVLGKRGANNMENRRRVQRRRRRKYVQ